MHIVQHGRVCPPVWSGDAKHNSCSCYSFSIAYLEHFAPNLLSVLSCDFHLPEKRFSFFFFLVFQPISAHQHASSVAQKDNGSLFKGKQIRGHALRQYQLAVLSCSVKLGWLERSLHFLVNIPSKRMFCKGRNSGLLCIGKFTWCWRLMKRSCSQDTKGRKSNMCIQHDAQFEKMWSSAKINK